MCDQLAKLIEHSDFVNKRRLAAFLHFVVINSLSGDHSRLKESVIGVEVYHRDPSYNPKLNPIVRTEARRLRANLEKYYATDGSLDPVVIEIPKGSYVAQFRFRDRVLSSKEEAADASRAPANGALNSEPSGQLVPPLEMRSFWRRGRSPVQLAAGLLGLCLLAAGTLTFLGNSHPAAVWSAKPFSRLGGTEEFSAFSPDGGELAFVWSGRHGTNRDIYLQSLKADSPTRLTENPAEDTRPAWSPDGKQIAFIRLASKTRKQLNVISVRTKEEHTIAELEGMYPWLCIIPRLSWSPDGRYLFTSANFGPGEACGVIAVDVKTHSIRRITQPPAGVAGDLEPAVSPDGKQIAFLRNAGEMGGDIFTVGVEGGMPRRVTFDNRDIMGFCWSADGKSLLISSRRGDGVVKLWQFDRKGRPLKQLTDGTGLATFPSAAAQGNRIAFTTYRSVTNIWRADSHGESLLISDDSGNSNPQLSPDGKRLVFRSDRTGAFELWTSDRDGQNGRRITHFNGPMVNSPSWSPDGKTIAFECRPQAHSDICLTSADGSGKVRQFTTWESNETSPSWSRDGRSLYFSSNYSGRYEIYKQPVSGGEPVLMTHEGGVRAVESWDGQSLYVHRGQPVGGIVQICLKATPESDAGPSETVLLPELTGGMWGDWDAGPGGLFFLKSEATGSAKDLMEYDPSTHTSRRRMSIQSDMTRGDRTFSVEPGGSSFLYVRTKSSEGEIGILERRTQGAP